MKVILSRKGFDSVNGGCASPIMPDGTLLSFPIPSNDSLLYNEIHKNNINCEDILSQLRPKFQQKCCHLDPDIGVWNRNKDAIGWKAAFGQAGAAQGVLSNANVEIGDIFLFFGWFRKVEIKNGHYCFVRKNTKKSFYDYADLHVIYGYMQIGDILTDKDEISKYWWHPHSVKNEQRNAIGTNALYLPKKSLTIDNSKEGYGTLEFRKDRVLTMEGQKRGTWNDYPFLMPKYIYGKKKNSAPKAGIYYNGIWQELVIYESDGLIDWVKSIIS